MLAHVWGPKGLNVEASKGPNVSIFERYCKNFLNYDSLVKNGNSIDLNILRKKTANTGVL